MVQSVCDLCRVIYVKPRNFLHPKRLLNAIFEKKQNYIYFGKKSQKL